MAGVLYIVATPIGNLEDLTIRALRVLKEADIIACEDTRHSRKLLAHYQISKPLVSYHEHNERERAAVLIEKLVEGMSVALVSDAGTPLISDPGFRIVRQAIDRGIQVVPIPGASALLAALSACGLAASEFTFAGFLPARQTARRARLKELADCKGTLILYEAPHRIEDTIQDALGVLGDRECVLARELTKVHEQFLRGSLSEMKIPEDQARGEFVLLIGQPLERSAAQVEPQSRSILEDVEQVMRTELLDQRSALKRVARSRGISKSEAYKLMIDERERR